MSNQLASSLSPYLLQHAHNPVHWRLWEDEAWQEAIVKDKLVLISIGYSACHWCHVMEHETFENEESARLMNEHLVCIKVDREERPDIDQLYMDACQLITHRGGWPLNVFCLPDGRPIHAGTYFTKMQWDEMVLKIAHFYATRKSEAEGYATELAAGIKEIDKHAFNADGATLTSAALDNVVEKIQQNFDPVYGGFNQAPKFPMPACWQFLLNYHSYTCNTNVRFQVQQTLHRMALGGIFDQIGGGFSRYSTDSLWKVPHFEKMLYDNAQLIRLYSSAWQLTRESLYARVVEETIEFLQRELLNETGLFYSALDADSEGEEGKYYVWTKPEFEHLAGEQNSLFSQYFQIGEAGLWENGNNILIAEKTPEQFAAENNLNPVAWNNQLQNFKKNCLAARQLRAAPGLDYKCITAWNALAIECLAMAGITFGKPQWTELASRCATAIQTLLVTDAGLHRVYSKGRVSVGAFLEDYALLAHSFIKLYEATANEKWMYEANNLVNVVLENFYDEGSGFFVFKSKTEQPLFAVKTDLIDDVIPSGNAVMADVLNILGHVLGKPQWISMAADMVRKVSNGFSRFPTGNGRWMDVQLAQLHGLVQVVVCCNPHERRQVQDFFASYLLPHVVWVWQHGNCSLPLAQHKQQSAGIAYFVCRGNSCHTPVHSHEEVLALIFG